MVPSGCTMYEQYWFYVCLVLVRSSFDFLLFFSISSLHLLHKYCCRCCFCCCCGAILIAIHCIWQVHGAIQMLGTTVFGWTKPKHWNWNRQRILQLKLLLEHVNVIMNRFFNESPIYTNVMWSRSMCYAICSQVVSIRKVSSRFGCLDTLVSWALFMWWFSQNICCVTVNHVAYIHDTKHQTWEREIKMR